MSNSKFNKTIPEESNVYRNANRILHSTPPGSYLLPCHVFYKHAIPSGLETDIQNNLKGLRYEQ